MSNISEKKIEELLDSKFFIPSYQRGYRWTSTQIEDLLNDIYSFEPTKIQNSNDLTWYCLQPIVVKECDEETIIENDLEGKWHEVIDGQQRLTSFFLIIHYFNDIYNKDQEVQEFQIQYKTRPTSAKFLKEQKLNEEDKVKIDYENVDFYHISTAYNTIHNWVKNFKKNNENKEFDHENFQKKLLQHSKVIWYEVEKDAIEIFTRINKGKIPLTNAELIKALFLNKSNFSNANSKEIRLRQLEIASEWDRIELALQNEELWYFINKEENYLPNHIDFIFNLIYDLAKEDCEESKFRKDKGITNNPDEIEKRKEEGYITIEEKYGINKYAPFHYFSKQFESNSINEIDTNWKEIKRYFQTIEEWFNDRELYHKVGLLITSGEKITDLLNEAKESNKNEFKSYLNGRISEKIKCDDLEELEYGNGKIKNILLLHNINTMLSNKESSNKFPFYRYKKYKWDIEHIHAIATNVRVKEEEQIDWLKNNHIKTKENEFEFEEKIENIKSGQTVEKEEFDEIINYVLEEEDNSLRNLCLLDQGTNRAYKNDAFITKRKKIIEKDKNGDFIPISTRNVFLKYYTPNPNNLDLWNKHDKEDYFEDLKKHLK